MEQRTPDGKQTKQRLLEQTAQALVAVLLLGSVSGCATIDYDREGPPYANARQSSRPVMIVQVLPGDTIESVSDRFNVPEDRIIEANDLHAPYRLHAGQSLTLPPSSVHVVAPGDTVASIARSYGVSANSLITVNNLRSPDALYPGERLSIPYVAPHQVARVERVERVPQSVTRSELPPPASQQYAEGVDPRAAGARYYNSPLPRPKPNMPGEGGPEFANAREASRGHSEPDPNDEAFDSPRRHKPVDRDGQQVAMADPADEAYDGHRGGGKPPAPTTDVKASNRFIWPVHGQIISGFGGRASGVHNDGINIAAEPGARVKAADGGVVVYAGNELAGYGNLLLIRHSNGYVTAYAHNRSLLVKNGDTVHQGQVIAVVGSTGNVDRPQLHFEIRKGDRAVDPSHYLESANASL